MAGKSVPAAHRWAAAGLEVLANVDFVDGRLHRPGSYVVCFGAEWCRVTRRFVPRFVELREKLPSAFAIADITDLKNPLWDEFRIRITPSIIVFRDGEALLPVDGRRFLGITKSQLATLEQALAEQ